MRVLRVGLLWLGLSGVVLAGGPATVLAAGASDGQIAFMSARSGGDAVWVMNNDGSGQTRLTTTADPAWDGFAVFSLDGRRIAYTCGNFEICVMNANGSDTVRVTTNPWPNHPVVDEVPTWSPDGTQIAFDRLVNGRDDLYVVNVDGSGLHQLTYGVSDENAAWSPDGTRIAFDAPDRSGNPQIFVVNADGTGRRQLTSGANENSRFPAWSPDGQQLVYVRAEVPFGLSHLWLVNADGTGAHALTSGAWNQSDPKWSPDGRLIAYDSNQGYEQNIWTINANGTHQTQLTQGAGYNIFPSWQPALAPPPTGPLPAVSTTPPSQPTPEARLVGVFYRAAITLSGEVGGLSHPSPLAALTLGVRLIADAVTLRHQAIKIAPTTKWGERFKRGLLTMSATARAAGNEYDAGLVEAVKHHRVLALRDLTAALRDIVRQGPQIGHLNAMI